jgi:hypothetical protein
MRTPESEPISNENAFARRSMLGAVGATLLFATAGCLSTFGSSKGAADVYIVNKTTEAQAISVSIQDADRDHKQLHTTLTLAAGEHTNPTAQDKIPRQSDYDVTVDVEEGPSDTYRWSDVDHSLYITLQEETLSFEIREHPPESWTPSS